MNGEEGTTEKAKIDDNRLSSGDRPQPLSPEVQRQARDVLREIGLRFSENRKKAKSGAFEQYQRDLAENMDLLVMGGAMSLKEISQTLMQLEEYRKQTSEQGKTQATMLGEWLMGKLGDEQLGMPKLSN